MMSKQKKVSPLSKSWDHW